MFIADAIESLDELDGHMRNVAIAIEAIPTSLDENGEGIVKSIEFLSQRATDEIAVTVEEGIERIGEIAEIERVGAQRDIERQRLETIEVLHHLSLQRVREHIHEECPLELLGEVFVVVAL